MAREIKRIERCLNDLWKEKDDRKQLVEDIALICPDQLTAKNIESVCTLLFDKEIGITTFLRSHADQSSEIRHEVLTMLINVAEKFGEYLQPYAADLIGICKLQYNQDDSAKVKNVALDLLMHVLEASSGYYQISELDIPGLIRKFLMELANPSKTKLTVRAKIYLLFGTLAHHYPEFMSDYAKKLFDIYLSAMVAEFRSLKKPEFLIIAACLEGCNKLLSKHTPYDLEEGVKKYYELFQAARSAAKPDLDLSRYEMPKASLILFENHSAFFIKFLQDCYEDMYDVFLKWFHHKNRELANHGQWAMEAFIYQISQAIVEDEDALQKNMFEFFLEKSNVIIKNKDSTKKEIDVAIKCFGLLAGPCKKFHTQDDVNFMFREMLEHSKHLFEKESENLHDQLYSLRGYLEALSSILKEIDCISDESLKIIEYLLVAMIENFPQVYFKYHFKCVKAILKVLLALLPKETHLREILRETVYQGLLRMSHLATPLKEMEQPPGTGTFRVWSVKKEVSYKDYISLWSNLLKSSSLKELSTVGYSFSDREKLTQLLYDEILTSVIHIIESLDLTINTSISQDVVIQPSASTISPMDSPIVSADPVHNIKLNCVQDHQVFYNIVNFCCEFLNKNEKKMFRKWLFRYCNFLVKISTSTPLVSGFHRLLTVCMKIARDLHYFEGISIDNLKITEDSSQTNAEKIACCILIKKYSKEILVQLKQYKEELLAACLALVLSLPTELIVDQIDDLLPAIQMSLSIGSTYLPLANAAMDTLEYWSETLSQDALKTVYSQVLPHLDPFIKTSERDSDDIDLTNIDQKKKRYFLDPDSELSKIKYRIAKYLGNIGGNFNKDLLANSDQDVLKHAVAWDTKKHLKFDLPFADMKPTIYLDPFLPPILELATKSSDRQTKVAACEFLHSAVLYSLGKSVQKGSSPEGNYCFSFEAIYKNVFPVLLQLACDLDQVPKQLFETLVFQLIHWFTSNKKFENAESMALLDAIYDGIIQSEDTGLRDFCAKCIAEFFKWSLKRKSSEKNPVNVISVLTRLYSYTLHPDPFKRLGAALAFNNFYTIFREHDILIDQFVFNLLVHFVKSLALCHKDDQSLGVNSQCCKALDHLERIILKKADMLKEVSSARKQPSQWNQITLLYAIRWLVRQCGRPQTSCRHACMKLVYNLAPQIQGIKQSEEFFQIFYEKEGHNYFIERFEGGGEGSDVSNSIMRCPQLEIREHFSLQKTCQWFDYFLAGLDCYIWVFENNLLSPEQMLQVAESNSQIIKAVCYFLEYIALSDLKTLTKNADYLPFTPKEEEVFNRNKCTVIIRIFSFLTTVLKKCKDAENSSVIPNEVWTPHLWRLICECVLQPEYVGFNLTDLEVVNKLPDENLLNIFLKKLPAEFKQQMRESIKNQLVNQRDLLTVLPIHLKSPNTNYFKLQQLLTGYRILNKVKLLGDMNLESLAAKLFHNVSQNIVTHSDDNQLTSRTLTPTELSLTQTLLELAIQLSMPINEFMAVMFTEEAHQQNTSCGKILLCIFKQEVSGYIIEHAAELIPLIMAKSDSNSQIVGHILISVLDILKHKSFRWKQSASQVCDIILKNLNMIENWWRDDASEDTQRITFDILLGILRLDSKVLSDGQNPTCELLHKFFYILLSKKTVASSFKVSLLDLLPFLSVSPEPHNSRLRTNLKKFLMDKSQPGTLLYDTYISLLDKILFALKKSKSKMLLELVIEIYCQEEKHCHEKDIHNCLETFIKRVSLLDQKSYVQIPFDLFLKTQSCTNNFRKFVIKKVCLPFLRNMSKIPFVEFLKSNIPAIVNIVEAEMSQLPDLMEQHLTDKMCCFQILEVMYRSMDVKELNGPGSEINSVYCKARNIEAQMIVGKELTKVITRIAHQTKKEDVHGETLFLELRRQVHCAAYNLLIAIISCTQTDLKFYNVFLFAENEEKKEFLLDNIIDKEKKYSFPIVFEMQPKKKTIFHTLQKEIKQKVVADASQSASYHLSSLYLENSSLSVDIGRYDYLSSNAEHQEIASISEKENSANSSAISEEKIIDYALEMDEINQSECMLPVVAVLKHMYQQNITPKENKEMPPWMNYLRKKFIASSTHLNIKLFIAKLIVNTAEIFEKYASFWVLPLSEFIILGNFEEKGINYFVLDIIVMILSWGEHSIPGDTSKDRYVASSLVQFIIRNIYNANRTIFRNNLKLLEALVGLWKARIDIPYKLLYEMMTSSDPNTGGLMVSVQLLGVLLKCNFSPYVNMTDVPRETYFSHLSQGLHHSHKIVYASTAEVLGLSLKYFDQHKDSEFEKFMKQIERVMKTLEPKLGNFIVCLHKMQLHYQPVAESYLPKLLYHLTKLHGDFQLYCLEILLGNINNVDGAFRELKSKNFFSFFAHRNKNIRLISLNIVKALLAKLKPNELAEIFSSINHQKEEPWVACRKVLYDILMWVYDNYGEETSEESSQIMSNTRELLLKGLEDKDYSCRILVHNFWSNRTRLPESTFDRMVAMFQMMYSPGTEHQFLYYSSSLLLEMTSKSPEYKREIFEYPLAECQFKEYRVKSHWQHRHSTMTPLFFDALSSSYMEVDDIKTENMGADELRATYGNQQFTPTQDVPFDWLTQSSLSSSMEVDSVDSGIQSSLLTVSGKATAVSQVYPTRKRPGPGFGQKKLSAIKDSQEDPLEENSQKIENKSRKFAYLKKRVLKDREAQSLYFAKKQITKNETQVQLVHEQKSKHEHQVTLYRKYRTGELPDIQIKYSALIATLQVVALRDSTVARLLFNSLFKGIFADAEQEKGDEDMETSIQSVQNSIRNMLKASEQHFPPFISCMLNILYDMDKELPIDIKQLISSSAITAKLQPLAIIVLEEQIIKGMNSCHPSKAKRPRQSLNPPPTDVSTWLELAKLYKSINEYDSVLGIFKDNVGCQEVSKMAIKAEIRGDYSEAIKHYVTAIELSTKEELCTWHHCYIQCLENLSRWDKVEKECVHGIDPENGDFTKVLDDSFNQENYLQPLIQSKLKLMQQQDINQTEFLKFIDNALKSPFKSNILEHQFSKELSLMFLWQENYDKALIYINNAIQQFLLEWSNTDILMKSRRKYLLQNLQVLSEIQNFLSFFKNKEKIKSCSSINRLFNCWEKQTPSLLEDPVKVWDDVITNRLTYIDQITIERNKPEYSDAMDTNDGNYFPKEFKLTLQLLRAESCCEQNNFKLARTILKKISGDCKHISLMKLKLKWNHLYVQSCQKNTLLSNDTCINLVNNLKILCEHDLSLLPPEEQSLRWKHNVLYGEHLSSLASVLKNEGDEFQFENLPLDIQQKISYYAGYESGTLSTKELSQKLIISGCEYLEKNVISDDSEEKSVSVRESIGETHLAIAKYCNQFLQDSPSLGNNLMSSLLKAIRYGIKEAQQRFCHLLQLLETHAESIDIFINESKKIPCWMFLNWINQMISLLDKPKAYAIHDIVYNIACQYPQAIIYSFKISNEGFRFEGNDSGTQNRKFVEKLSCRLNSKTLPQVFTFISSLESFAEPLNVFKDWFKNALQLYSKTNPKKQEVIELYKDMCSSLFEENVSPYYQKFTENFHSLFVNSFGKDGSKINKMNKQELQKQLLVVKEKLEKQKLKEPKALEEFSSWMANFDPLLDTLEIPGQYHGFSKPLLEYHIKISGFDQQVQTFRSLQKPRKIIIRGNNQKEYPFIVKCGEDLRQDQRIGQLSEVINEIFFKNSICQTKRLQLKTYQIIPMTTRVGLLECLENVLTLQDTLQKVLEEKENYIMETIERHREFKKKYVASGIMNIFKKCKKTDAELGYQSICARIPQDLLRKSFKKMSTSPEAFHVLRTGFTISHAVLCICHYILGVGDRHLSNLMIHQGTGQMIGIDFGHAFGSATQYLLIPELIPFRLTRQLQNVCLPHGTKGTFERTMVHCLESLRSDKDLLIHTLEIFVREPSFDWLKNARNNMHRKAQDFSEEEDLSWYPKEKIDFVKRKLDGEHPAYITRDELNLNSHVRKSDALESITSIVLGTEGNVRYTLPQKHLTVEQQITALIDLATDPNILIRTFEGWNPLL
ncbi:DNA-dependent protein kinase catalytic subunit isoform X2 [Octopus sinensis]|uniref:DNA-dependent protein kinase catalytic subunit n=1 Tax=Octopus sinensis TaxID=2607531 RepID=A0A7E6EW50_9MOLL|nr:DNA-dependent protein kinase catalytic subunit isoform X2 [Octopus sinensis]